MFVMPEIALQRIVQYGIKQLRNDKEAFEDLFSQFVQDELAADYGQAYLDQIWEWFSTTKIPVVQAWSFNTQRIPCVSIHLANETEDESKAAFSDFMGDMDEGDEIGTASFTVMVDIGIHAAKSGDHVLWLYYIVSYVLFKHKLMADRFNMKLHTFSASDYSKDAKYMTENIFTRWVRFRCTTQNFWKQVDGAQFDDIEEVNTEVTSGVVAGGSSSGGSTGSNISNQTVTGENDGIMVSRQGDTEDVEDMAL